MTTTSKTSHYPSADKGTNFQNSNLPSSHNISNTCFLDIFPERTLIVHASFGQHCVKVSKSGESEFVYIISSQNNEVGEV